MRAAVTLLDQPDFTDGLVIVSVDLDDAVKGTFTSASLGSFWTAEAPGRYTTSDAITLSQAQSRLRALWFEPVGFDAPRDIPAERTQRTHFTIEVRNSTEYLIGNDASTQVIADCPAELYQTMENVCLCPPTTDYDAGFECVAIPTLHLRHARSAVAFGSDEDERIHMWRHDTEDGPVLRTDHPWQADTIFVNDDLSLNGRSLRELVAAMDASQGFFSAQDGVAIIADSEGTERVLVSSSETHVTGGAVLIDGGLQGDDVTVSGGAQPPLDIFGGSPSDRGGSVLVAGGPSSLESGLAGSAIVAGGNAVGDYSAGGDAVLRAGAGTAANGMVLLQDAHGRTLLQAHDDTVDVTATEVAVEASNVTVEASSVSVLGANLTVRASEALELSSEDDASLRGLNVALSAGESIRVESEGDVIVSAGVEGQSPSCKKSANNAHRPSNICFAPLLLLLLL